MAEPDLTNLGCVVSALGLDITPNTLQYPKEGLIDDILARLDPAFLISHSHSELVEILDEAMGKACDPVIIPNRVRKRAFIIGAFSRNIEPTYDPVFPSRVINFPSGREVNTRLVDYLCYLEPSADRMFHTHIGSDGSRIQEETLLYEVESLDGVGHGPNILVREGPFHYLQAWIDWDSLPNRRYPIDPEPMSFVGELYEIVHSRKKPLST